MGRVGHDRQDADLRRGGVHTRWYQLMNGDGTPHNGIHTHWLARVYRWSLRLYPAHFRADFGSEMADVFAQALDDAARRGMLALVALAWQELRDWPIALFRSRLGRHAEVCMDESLDTMPSSWPGVLAGLWPFILLGPVAMLLAYPHPLPAWRASPTVASAITLVYVLSICLGFACGWSRGWPTWSFAYMGPVIFVPAWTAANAINTLTRLSIGWWWWHYLQAPLTLAVFGLMIGVVVLIGRRWHAWQGIRQGAAADWTRLSFGLFLMAAAIFGAVDYDEDPSLTAFAILPTLAIVLGAAVYLRSRTQTARALALATALCLALAIRIVDGQWFYIIYWLLLVALVFFPGLVYATSPRRSATSS